MLTRLLLILLLGLNGPAMADELLLQGILQEPDNTLQGVPRPKPGMPSANVVEIFGQPRQRFGPVGSPPISRWVYDDFVVVFEGDRVVNSVIKKARSRLPATANAQ